MYVDYDIPVCQQLPRRTLEEIAILDKAYAEDDVGAYMLHEESVFVDVKAAGVDRLISMTDMHLMFKRFGWE